jgi:predicted DNA-binding ribbon-helix-helix protein
MNSFQDSQEFPLEIQAILRRKALFTEGKLEAFQLAWDCKGNVNVLVAKLQEEEEQITNPPSALRPAMIPSAAPRMFKDGYIEGLKEAIELISALSGGQKS